MLGKKDVDFTDVFMLDDIRKINKIFAAPRNIRILRILNSADIHICEKEFCSILAERNYNISRSMTILTNAGFIKMEQKGVFKYFYLNKKNAGFSKLLTQNLNRLNTTDPVIAADWKRFWATKLRYCSHE